MSSAPKRPAPEGSDRLEPPRLPGSSLTLRLTLWYGTFVIVVAALTGSVLYVVLDEAARTNHRLELLSVLDAHALTLEREGVRGLEAPYAELRALHLHTFFARVRSRAGVVVFERRPAELLVAQSPAPALGETLFFETPDQEGSRWFFASRHIRGYTVDVGHRATGQSARRTLTILLLAGGAVAILFLLGGFFVVHRALAPVRHLGDRMRDTLRSEETHARVSVGARGDELDALGGLFNQVLERNDRLVETLRSALDDVAHDLRTPLTRLRARAELGLRESEASPQEALADCIEETDRVLQTLRAITDVSEAEAGVLRLTKTPVDLAKVVTQVDDLYELVADEAGVSLVTEVASDASLIGDEARLRQAIANLVDNAIKYSERGDQIRLNCTRTSDEIRVEVVDEGIGITVDALPRIFDRLYRVDPSRGERGMGLGLSLVRAIAQAHGGRVEVESELGRGSRFTLVFPIA